ncbi:MAG: ribosome biogenesis GTPase Der [Bacteroidetes bacterium]|nr:ribosome biogenesis GTPase Der [Bacteroidota bacterium]
MGNMVALVGRPNVGKSTLFNRLTESRQAIVDETSGVTRDRHYGKADWIGRDFSVIDTGGYVFNSDDVFEGEIRKQVELAIDESNIILFLLDAQEGLSVLDEDVANLLRRSKKNVFIVANKVDNNKIAQNIGEFYTLGLGEVYCVSSINGSGTGELLDAIVAKFDDDEPEVDTDLPKFTVVGRPNVGKSSLINSLLGKDRNIVTSIAGTTRDSIYTRYNNFGFDFLLVDTAGLRKKGKVFENIEFYSVMRSIRAIENCDVCLVMIDAATGIEAQDMNIFRLAEKNRKGIVLLVNKWDLVAKENNTHIEYEKILRERLAPFTDIPIIFISATSKQRIFKALEEAVKVYENRTRRITTSELNRVMLPIIEENPPPTTKGKYIRIKYITQLPTYSPSFVFFCNLPQYVNESYGRFIENRLRENFDFTGVPIQVFFRQK